MVSLGLGIGLGLGLVVHYFLDFQIPIGVRNS